MALERLLEQVLVLRAQAGDADALDELVRRHERPVRDFVYSLLPAEAGGEDVFQEVWLTVCRKLGGLHRPTAFRAWLYRIARNAAFLELRRRRRWRPLADEPQVVDDSEANPVLDIEPGRLTEALGALSPEHREVLGLRFLRGMGYAEIAAVTGTAIGTVRSRLHYARAALCAILKEKPNA